MSEKRNFAFDHKDKIYDSESDMARAYEIKPQVFSYRKRKGLPLSVCLSPVCKLTGDSDADGFTYKGKQYKSFRACCEDLKISYITTYKRVYRKGLSPTESIDISLAKKNNVPGSHYYIKGDGITYNDKWYANLRACCEDLNVSYTAVYTCSRNKHISYEEAIKRCLELKAKREAKSA